MGGAPILVILYRNGIFVRFARPQWFTNPTLLQKAYALKKGELGNQIWNCHPDYKEITDAMPAVDTFEYREQRNEDYVPTKEDSEAWKN